MKNQFFFYLHALINSMEQIQMTFQDCDTLCTQKLNVFVLHTYEYKGL